MTRIEELLSTHYNPGYFTLIDKTHPLSLYIGIDEDGHYAFEYEGLFKPLKTKESSAIGVNYFQKKENKSVVFFLKDESMLSPFCAFCEDLVESSRNASNNDNGYSLLINRYYTWKKMFHQGREKLDEKDIMGLIGELLFLRNYLFARYSKYVALNSWTGLEKTRKDFSLDDTWYEVKTIHSGKDTVGISSFEQLDSDTEGHLVIYQLERMSPEFCGVSLNKLFKQIYEELEIDMLRDILLQKMSDAGYTFEKVYDDYVYELKKQDIYTVSGKFPCLHRTPELSAIAKVQYEIILSQIEIFKES